MSESSTIHNVLKISGGYEDLAPERFAGRKEEQQLVDRRVQDAQKGEIEYPLLEFHGVVGQGKSWLLSYLAYQYWLTSAQKLDKPSFSAKADLGLFRTYGDALALLQALTAQIREQLSTRDPDLEFPRSLAEDAPHPKDVNDTVREFSEFLILLTQRYVPVLIFDALEEADDDLIDWVESRLVYPIVRTNRAIFVASGRRFHRWKIFEVRRRIAPRELFPLDAKRVDVEGTIDLLTKLKVEHPEAAARALYEYAFGHPLASKVIVDELQSLLHGRIEEHTFEQNQDVLAEIVKTKVIDGRFFGRLNSNRYLIPLLWAVCILRKFNPTPLRHFTTKFLTGAYDQQPGGFYLDAIRDMQDTTLVQWTSAAGGYTLDLIVRKIMAKNLSLREPEEFKRRHQEAVKSYDDWIKQYPRNAVGFLIERTFHRCWSLKASTGPGAPQTTQDALVTEFKRILADVKKHPDVQWELLDMAAALEEELAKDEELQDILSPGTFEKLRELAQGFRSGLRELWP